MNTLQLIFLLFFFPTLLFLYCLPYKRNQNHRRLPPSPPSFPIIGHLHHLGPLIHQSFHALSTRYGSLIHLRLGSVPCVVVSTPDLAKDFLKTNELAFSSRKHSLAIDHITYGVAFAFAPYGTYWKFIKKLFTVELLGTQNLSHFLPIRTHEIRELLRTLMVKSRAKERVNLTEELLKLTNNVISQMMMSIRCSGTNSEADEAKNLVREVTKIFGQFNVSDFIWFCKNIDLQGFKKRYEGTHRRYDALLERIIMGREENRRRGKIKDGEGKDFLDMLLDVLEDGKAEIKITRDHIKALILDFLTAGTDTTAIAIEWALVELINNPNALEKARQEIDQVIGDERLVQESDTPNLPYIQAIIKEALRLHPPIPMLIRKSTENVIVQGYDIPAGTLLFVNIWSIGRNPQCWETPLEFKPHRFLDGGDLKSSLDIKGHNFQLLPFGTGRRGCPGVNLAMRELSVVIANLIQCFDWDVVGERLLNTDERAGLTAPRAVDFVCVPLERGNTLKILGSN
uniref:Cytochrome P450 93B2 n=1 Tax=Gerbera hybrida TaxID=18101 RepID=C93B2_GERHY|nr:RecName: Full=Cytochrome P450 93B2; AltName: Full=Flavone synthase II; Short=FNSII [Gerbera hybrid cultivar]AAD39549.1 flavone synthase II [Gerbera hybrid cultivar]